MGILMSARMRAKPKVLYGASLLAVLGFVTNRMNVSITGFESAQGGHYIPAFGEVMITLMMVALGFAAFHLIVKHFPVYPDQHEAPARSTDAGAALPPAVSDTELAPWEKTLLHR